MLLKLEDVFKISQPALKCAIRGELIESGYSPLMQNGFLYAPGELPVLLVAHLDTVHKQRVQTFCYSNDGKIMMSPEGIGGDDRSGVYMILQIIQKHKCHVLFCEDEEIGGIGASHFAVSGIVPDVNYIIELDRKGDNDAVFYDCYNPAFTDFVCGFGFQECCGSFSDISIIAPALRIAAVNISAGFYNEHTLHEHVDISVMKNNILRIAEMVQTPSETFEYVESECYMDGLLNAEYEEIIGLIDMYLICIIEMMEIVDSAYIQDSHGEMVECNGQYYLDEMGKVYKYYDEFGIAVELHCFHAMSEHNVPVQFIPSKADPVEVVSPQCILHLYGDQSMLYNSANGLGSDPHIDWNGHI